MDTKYICKHCHTIYNKNTWLCVNCVGSRKEYPYLITLEEYFNQLQVGGIFFQFVEIANDEIHLSTLLQNL